MISNILWRWHFGGCWFQSADAINKDVMGSLHCLDNDNILLQVTDLPEWQEQCECIKLRNGFTEKEADASKLWCVRSGVLTVVLMKCQVFLDAMLYQVVKRPDIKYQ